MSQKTERLHGRAARARDGGLTVRGIKAAYAKMSHRNKGNFNYELRKMVG